MRVARGPTLWLPHGRRLPDSRALLLDAAAGHVLRGGLDAWIPDLPYRRPFVASLVDGRAVAVCASARITPEACEAGVETVAAHRRAGHAANAVAGWARAVRELGALPLHSTSWDNAGSIGLARKLGFVPYGEEFQVS